MKVFVESDPFSDDDDNDDKNSNDETKGDVVTYEKAKIIAFNDMKGEYKVKFLGDGTTDNEVPENEIKPIPETEQGDDDEDEEEDEVEEILLKHEYKVIFTKKALGLGIKDRTNKLGIIVTTINEDSEANGKYHAINTNN